MGYRVALIADNHFIKKNDKYYVNGTYTKQYLSRFTNNFDELIVLARGRDATDSDNTDLLHESGGNRISFFLLDDFFGVKAYLFNRAKLKKDIESVFQNVDAVFIRMPCILTTISLKCAQRLNLPIMIDIGADPESIYRSSNNSLFRFCLSKYLKIVCKKATLSANGVSYVTKYILQEKYPCSAIKNGETIDHFTASISNVDISDSFLYANRYYEESISPLKILHVSNNIIVNSSKGHDECLQVVALLKKFGIDIELTFLGDGNGISSLKQKAANLGITNEVIFAGRITNRDQYRNILLNNHLFLFPSHSEGLPRVLIEAMATGMVCIASNVDGIPELLSEDNIFDYNDIEGMAKRIATLFKDPKELNSIGAYNYRMAKEYTNNNLCNSYNDYYSKVRNLIDSRRIDI